MKTTYRETRRTVLAATYLLMAFAWGAGAGLSAAVSFTALGDERWLKAALFAGMVAPFALLGVWSWRRLQLCRPADYLPERFRAHLADTEPSRRKFRAALVSYSLVLIFAGFFAGLLSNDPDGATVKLRQGCWRRPLWPQLWACIGYGALNGYRSLMRYAPAAATDERPEDTRPPSTLRGVVLGVATPLLVALTALLLIAGSCGLAGIWVEPEHLDRGFMWGVGILLGLGVLMAWIAYSSTRGLIRWCADRRAAASAARRAEALP